MITSSCGILQAYEVKEAAKTQAGREKAAVTIQRKGQVYLLSEHNLGLESLRTGYYKIGKTTQDVNKRINDLQGGNPREIKRLESHPVPDMDEAEQRAHHATQRWNTKESHHAGSEWFYVPHHEFSEFHEKFNNAVHNRQEGEQHGQHHGQQHHGQHHHGHGHHPVHLVRLLKAMMRMM